MKRGPTWLQLGIALGLVIALAVVSPAIGGPSLRDLVRQEVTRQLDQRAEVAKKKKAKPVPGPAGPQGAPGLAGAQGAIGAQGPGARKLDFDQPETDDQFRPLATLHELTITARCFTLGGISALDVFATSNGIAGSISFSVIRDFNGGVPATPFNNAVPLPADSLQFFTSAHPGNSSVERSEIQAIYRNANRVITIPLHFQAHDGTGRCELNGAAIPAS